MARRRPRKHGGVSSPGASIPTAAPGAVWKPPRAAARSLTSASRPRCCLGTGPRLPPSLYPDLPPGARPGRGRREGRRDGSPSPTKGAVCCVPPAGRGTALTAALAPLPDRGAREMSAQPRGPAPCPRAPVSPCPARPWVWDRSVGSRPALWGDGARGEGAVPRLPSAARRGEPSAGRYGAGAEGARRVMGCPWVGAPRRQHPAGDRTAAAPRHGPHRTAPHRTAPHCTSRRRRAGAAGSRPRSIAQPSGRHRGERRGAGGGWTGPSAVCSAVGTALGTRGRPLGRVKAVGAANGKKGRGERG